MRLLAALAAVFKVLPGEGRLLLLLMAESFCLGLSRLFTQTASGTLFLVNFDVRDLPYVYIAVAITVPLIGAAYARLESWLPLPRLLVANLGSLLLVLAVLAISLALTDARWPAFALAVWYEAIWAMTSLALWGLAGRMFNVRQGKRLFALISAGDVVAATVGGFLTPVLVNSFGIGSLLLGALGGLVGALCIVAYITRAFGGSLVAADDDAQVHAHTATSPSLYRRYVMMIIGLVVVSHASFYFIDNIFYNQVEARYADETQLASFLGVFWAIVNLLMLLSNLFVVSRVVGRYGVQAGLLVLPAVTALVTVTLLVGGAFLALPSFVFALAVLNNLLDWTLRESIYKSSLLILYQPLPAARRFRTQALSESMAQPVAQGLAGLALLGLGLVGFGVLQTTALLLAMLVASILLAWPLAHRYAAVVMQALNRRSLSGAPVWQPAGRHAVGSGQPALLDGAAVALVRHEVANPHPGIAIYVLNVLEEMEHPSLVDAFAQTLEHSSPVVRHEALRRLERRGTRPAAEAVRRRVAKEPDPEVRGAAVRTLAVLGADETLEQIIPYLTHPDLPVRQGAMAGFLRRGDPAGVPLVREQLDRLLDSPEAAERAAAARVLGESRRAMVDQPLCRLLADPVILVRRAALEAAGKSKDPRLWPIVIDALEAPALRGTAAAALVEGGETVLPALRASLARPDLPVYAAIRLIRVAARIWSRDADELLKTCLASGPPGLRHHVLLALTHRGFHATNGDRAGLLQMLRHEVAEIVRSFQAQVDLSEDGASLLTTALQEAIDHRRETIFLVLACLYDASLVMRVRDNLAQGTADKRAYAFEALDTLIAHELKPVVLPVMDDLTPAGRLERLRRLFPQSALSRAERLRDIIGNGDAPYSSWLRACAVYALLETPTNDAPELVSAAVGAADPLLRKTARWALARIDPAAYRSRCDSSATGDGAMLSVIEKVLVLKTVSIFAATPDNTLAEVAGLLEEVDLAAGETLFTAGEAGRCMYIIVAGRVRVHQGDHLLNELGERDIVGEMAVLSSAPRVATVTAAEDTRLLKLDQDPLYELMSDHIDIARGIIEVLSGHLRARVEDLAALRARPG